MGMGMDGGRGMGWMVGGVSGEVSCHARIKPATALLWDGAGEYNPMLVRVHGM